MKQNHNEKNPSLSVVDLHNSDDYDTRCDHRLVEEMKYKYKWRMACIGLWWACFEADGKLVERQNTSRVKSI